MIWEMKRPHEILKMLGLLPNSLSEDDPRPAREQIDANYVRGWRPLLGFEMASNGDLLYMDDPPAKLLAETRLRNETIQFYVPALMVITQEDGSWEVSRVD